MQQKIDSGIGTTPAVDCIASLVKNPPLCNAASCRNSLITCFFICLAQLCPMSTSIFQSLIVLSFLKWKLAGSVNWKLAKEHVSLVPFFSISTTRASGFSLSLAVVE